jgi:hypothetical protein
MLLQTTITFLGRDMVSFSYEIVILAWDADRIAELFTDATYSCINSSNFC